MLNALKNLFAKLFPKKLATETTAELPTPTPVFEEPIKVADYEITIHHDVNTADALVPLEQPLDDMQSTSQQLFTDPAPSTVESFEIPVVEELKPKRARNKGKFAPDDKITIEYNEAWIGGKSPAKKNNKKKKK